MNELFELSRQTVLRSVGRVLMHFVWQGTVVLMLLLIALQGSISWAAQEKPIQVKIEARATEVNAEDLTALALDKFPDSGYTQESTNFSKESFALAVITEPQAKIVYRTLERRKVPLMLSHPSITTLSGRKVLLDLGTINDPVPAFWTNWISGLAFSVVPFVAEDGFTHRLRVNHKTTIYDDPGPFQPNTNWAHLNQPPPPDSNPVPKARSKSVTLSRDVWDGQTLVLIGRPFVKGEGGQLKQISPLILITPKVVDDAGEPVHHPVSLPFDINSVPEQPDSQTLE